MKKIVSRAVVQESGADRGNRWAGSVRSGRHGGRDAQRALSVPHAQNRFGACDLEAGTAMAGMAAALAALGYRVEVRELNSGLHVVSIGPGGLQGGARPRWEDIAPGE